MIFTEEQLRKYAKPLSETEENQCKNAIRMVVDALKTIGFNERSSIQKMYSETPSFEVMMKSNDDYEVKIFLQGSYANNTNVRQHSDVDIAVVQINQFRTKYREGVSNTNYGFTTASSKSNTFKDIVQSALESKFGDDVERKNKSIKIHGNSYRKDADSVPALRYRDYSYDYRFDPKNYVGGILIKADDGTEVINYPEQHIKNGIDKNKRTNLYFKKMVRIAKEMRYQMQDEGYEFAQKVSSFGVESLLYNVPDEIFVKYNSYKYIFDDIVEFLYDNKHNINSFDEVNGIKKLCDDSDDREKIYKGFIDELKGFYSYEI